MNALDYSLFGPVFESTLSRQGWQKRGSYPQVIRCGIGPSGVGKMQPAPLIGLLGTSGMPEESGGLDIGGSAFPLGVRLEYEMPVVSEGSWNRDPTRDGRKTGSIK